jgi:hypothetical protein
MSVAGMSQRSTLSSVRSGMSVERMTEINKLLHYESGVFILTSFFYLSSFYSRTDIVINV